MSGPIDGDTRVVIFGENLGTSSPDVSGVFVTVTIGNTNCAIESRNLTTSVYKISMNHSNLIDFKNSAIFLMLFTST